jgi:hypothetical protein
VTDDTSHPRKGLECLADLTCDGGSPRERPGYSVRRKPSGNRIAEVRLAIYDGDYEASVAVVRNALGDEDFQSDGPKEPHCRRGSDRLRTAPCMTVMAWRDVATHRA